MELPIAVGSTIRICFLYENCIRGIIVRSCTPLENIHLLI